VLGLTKKEIDEKIDEIIDFAEIREFIDMPVQSYSSGMQVRLGFAVATAMNPDVLILDEVLAVGDGSFRHKCYQRIDSLRSRAAIIFVSHNMPDVGRICQSTVVMERGRTIFNGGPLEGISCYNDLNSSKEGQSNAHLNVQHPIKSFSITAPDALHFNKNLELDIEVVSEEKMENLSLTIAFSNPSGAFVATGITDTNHQKIDLHAGTNFFKCSITNVPLRNGAYPISIHLNDARGDYLAIENNLRNLRIFGANECIPSDCQLEFSKITKILN
jgi:lipopolysaccharide transport system ATP-binding protein